METNLLACNSNWLDDTGSASNMNNNLINTIIPYQDFYYPYYYPVYYQSPTRPIKLTLSEIEKLRGIAKKDKEIKNILTKFTSLIEIMVDF